MKVEDHFSQKVEEKEDHKCILQQLLHKFCPVPKMSGTSWDNMTPNVKNEIKEEPPDFNVKVLENKHCEIKAELNLAISRSTPNTSFHNSQVSTSENEIRNRNEMFSRNCSVEPTSKNHPIVLNVTSGPTVLKTPETNPRIDDNRNVIRFAGKTGFSLQKTVSSTSSDYFEAPKGAQKKTTTSKASPSSQTSSKLNEKSRAEIAILAKKFMEEQNPDEQRKILNLLNTFGGQEPETRKSSQKKPRCRQKPGKIQSKENASKRTKKRGNPLVGKNKSCSSSAEFQPLGPKAKAKIPQEPRKKVEKADYPIFLPISSHLLSSLSSQKSGIANTTNRDSLDKNASSTTSTSVSTNEKFIKLLASLQTSCQLETGSTTNGTNGTTSSIQVPAVVRKTSALQTALSQKNESGGENPEVGKNPTNSESVGENTKTPPKDPEDVIYVSDSSSDDSLFLLFNSTRNQPKSRTPTQYIESKIDNLISCVINEENCDNTSNSFDSTSSRDVSSIHPQSSPSPVASTSKKRSRSNSGGPPRKRVSKDLNTSKPKRQKRKSKNSETETLPAALTGVTPEHVNVVCNILSEFLQGLCNPELEAATLPSYLGQRFAVFYNQHLHQGRENAPLEEK